MYIQRQRNSVVYTLTLFVVAATVAACGGDDDGKKGPAATSTPTSTITARATATPTQTANGTGTAPPIIPPSSTPTDLPTASATVTPTITVTPTVTQTLTAEELVFSVGETEAWALAGLRSEVQVLRTEGSVAHIYARNRRDLSFVQGFVTARDRYFMMELTRRLGLGRVSELIGDAALDTDIESRGSGMTLVADRLAAGMSAEHAEIADAFAAGINAYIKEVQARRLPLPSELRLAAALLGTNNPASLMQPFTRRDLGGIAAVIVYNLSYETGDVGRDGSRALLDTIFEGAALGDLRRAGVLQDILPAIDPVYPVSSGFGFGLETGGDFIPGPGPGDVPGASGGSPAGAGSAAGSSAGPSALEQRLAARLEDLRVRLGRYDGYGSNSWAVAGSKTADGAALIAGDGHLQLDIPSIFYQIGFDTAVLGGGDIHQIGLTIPGFPVLGVGTNGNVAWGQTQLSADVTDWYREEITLDDTGAPAESLFRGEQRPLQRFDETFIIADVPALGSEGRTETWPRWTTFDGRLITDIEGREATRDEQLGDGETLVYTLGGIIVPGDVDGDGKINAISVDYSAFDVVRLFDAVDGFGRSANVAEFREHTKGLIAYSQNIIAADGDGDILYTSYHAVPCRGYLDRLPDGRFADGANPMLLLDGTRYGGFTIPLTNGLVDENAADGDPQRCLVPFDSTPQSISPERGYVLTANNDPGNIALDKSLEDDPWYIGGPWDTGFRADTLRRELASTVAGGDGDVARMAEIQANHDSRVGELFVPWLSQTITSIRNLQLVDRLLTPSEDRQVTLYASDTDTIDDVQRRLDTWVQRGAGAKSGVETFYHSLEDGEVEDAVATMLFNAWFSRALSGVWGDEGNASRFFEQGDQTRVLLLSRFLEARDTGDTTIASYNTETGESAFFDVLGTPDIETSNEVFIRALVDALAFLRSAPSSAGVGGFGSDDMDRWIWGLRHQVRFESLLAPFLGNDPTFDIFTRPFAIDTGKLPLAPNLPVGDPRRDLRWFPRPGDQWVVDAANPGFSGTSFTHGSGPVFRMVFALKDGNVSGQNVIPGGQSGLTDSPFFSDQARLWLANETLPIRFTVDEVVAGATGREVYRPSGCRSSDDCQPPQDLCLAPGEHPPCPICINDVDNPCTTDADCAALGETYICEEIGAGSCPAPCNEPLSECRGGCADDEDCDTGETCAEHHCIATPCGDDLECPLHFSCIPAQQSCQRRSCSQDGDCGNGFCVEGECYEDLGVCSAIPA